MLLIGLLGVVFAAVTPYVNDHIMSGGLEIATALFAQELIFDLPLALLTIAILGSLYAKRSGARALIWYFTWLVIVVAAEATIWWIYEAPGHMNPGLAPGDDYGAGLIGLLFAVTAPWAILAFEGVRRWVVSLATKSDVGDTTRS